MSSSRTGVVTLCLKPRNSQNVGSERSRPSQLVGMRPSLTTSESENEGHPDKRCDEISDVVNDACLAQDPEYEKMDWDVRHPIGFVSDDADNRKVPVTMEQQSPDIAHGVHGHFTGRSEVIVAGDQGDMSGYATDEARKCMPLSHVLATKLGARVTEVRKNGTCRWLGPDGKIQVTFEYYNENGAMVPGRLRTVLISTQVDVTVTNDQISADLKEHVIKPVIPEKYLDEKTIYNLDPSGRSVVGGPHGDAGLTGREIIIDTYGGWGVHGGGGDIPERFLNGKTTPGRVIIVGPHGDAGLTGCRIIDTYGGWGAHRGGAFFGKDPAKVDRSGADIVRQATAKSIVTNELAYIGRQAAKGLVAIGLAYIIGKAAKNIGAVDKEKLEIFKENFKLFD